MVVLFLNPRLPSFQFDPPPLNWQARNRGFCYRGFYYCGVIQSIIRHSSRLLQHLILKDYKIKTLLLIAGLLVLPGCSSVMKSATGGLADNLNAAILNQVDPETVRDGAPAYLIMLDSFVEGAPDDARMLAAAADLYAAYGVVFAANPERADRLTTRARSYGQRALCASNRKACGLDNLAFKEFGTILSQLSKKDAPSLFTYGLSGLAYIKAHSSDWSAMANLPRIELALQRVQQLNSKYQPEQVEHYLAVLQTLRPPALGGDFESGKAHYERAIALSQGKDLSISVDYARYYARTLYDRELHDQLLNEVLAADAKQNGYTLFNVIAQREARQLLDSANDYF